MAEERLGTYLRRKREERGLSLPLVAARTADSGKGPLSINTIRDIEDGKRIPKPETLRRLALALTGYNVLTHTDVMVPYEELLRRAGYLQEAREASGIDLGEHGSHPGLMWHLLTGDALELWEVYQQIPAEVRPAALRILRDSAVMYDLGRQEAGAAQGERPLDYTEQPGERAALIQEVLDIFAPLPSDRLRDLVDRLRQQGAAVPEPLPAGAPHGAAPTPGPASF